MKIEQHNPPHPGGFIKRVYIDPFKLGINELAKELHVSASTLSRLINEKSNISPEMALKLSKVIGRSAESWLLMQDNYNLWKAKTALDLSGYKAISFAY